MMEEMLYGKETVSVSEVLLVINGGPPTGIDPEASREGIKAHKELAKRITDGNIPLSLRKIGLKPPVKVETRFSTEIDTGLSLTARADIVGEGLTVDAKPGGINQRQLIQAGLTHIARGGQGVGAVYSYQHDQTHVIASGLEDAREELVGLAIKARRVLDNQQELHDRPSLKGAAKDAIGGNSFRLREEMIGDIKIIMQKIKVRVVK